MASPAPRPAPPPMAPQTQPQHQQLHLNPELQHEGFESWRLGRAPQHAAPRVLPLPAPVAEPAAASGVAPGLLHAQAAALHNHLHLGGPGWLLVCTRAPGARGAVTCVHRLDVDATAASPGGEGPGPKSLALVAEMQQGEEALVGPALAASVAVLAGAGGEGSGWGARATAAEGPGAGGRESLGTAGAATAAPAPQPPPLAVSKTETAAAQAPAPTPAPAAAPAAVAGASSPSSPPSPTLLVASCGAGDLRLIVMPFSSSSSPGVASYPSVSSAPVFPLRPLPPLAGVRPFQILAAYAPAGGPDAAGNTRAGSGIGSGEGNRGDGSDGMTIRCVLWAARARRGSHPARAEVFAVTLHTLAGVGEAGAPAPRLEVLRVDLLAVSPLPPHGAAASAAADSVLVALQPLQPGEGDGDEEDEQDVAHIDCTKAGAGGRDGLGGDDDDDDVDPRTLEQAVARLAKYTSEEPVTGLPPNQWADMYKESGPEGLGAMGSEPYCELRLFALGRAPGGNAAAPSSASAAPALQPVWTLDAGAHRLLSAQVADDTGSGSNSCSSSGGDGLLLGLTDDVDCAVVRVRLHASDGGGGVGGPEVVHEASLPALAYVAAGKTQRRHLLLGSAGSAGSVAAVLVEASRYCYVYRPTARGQQHGRQDLLELEGGEGPGEGEGEGGQRVLGARLLACEGGRGVVLLVLTPRRLLFFGL